LRYFEYLRQFCLSSICIVLYPKYLISRSDFRDASEYGVLSLSVRARTFAPRSRSNRTTPGAMASSWLAPLRSHRRHGQVITEPHLRASVLLSGNTRLCVAG
jgi:hypothetical protein